MAQKVCTVVCEDLPDTDPVEVTMKRQGNLKKAEDEEDEESKFWHEEKLQSVI